VKKGVTKSIKMFNFKGKTSGLKRKRLKYELKITEVETI